MKNLLLLLSLFVVLNLSANAQITITSADFSLSATTAITGRDTSSFIRPWLSGANQLWDFSAFVPSTLDTTNSNLSSFAANPLFPTATNGACSALPFGSFCTYFDISSSGIYLLGLDNSFNIGFMSHQVSKESPAALIYPLPLNYNQSVSQSYVQHQLNVNSSPSPTDSTKIIYYRAQTITVDGWGTLITPYNTYTTLRIKKINSNLDTTYNHTTAGGWSTGQAHALHTDTTFIWLANGVFEVATISSYSPIIHRYSFLKSSTATGFAENLKQLSSTNIYPNPVAGNLFIQSIEKIKSISCTNYIGQTYDVRLFANSLDVSSLSAGVYFLTLFTEKGNRETKKFVKQ